MTGAAVQEWLPIVEEPSRRSGICPAQWFQGAIQRKEIWSPRPIAARQIQPASIDLRLGKRRQLQLLLHRHRDNELGPYEMLGVALEVT